MQYSILVRKCSPCLKVLQFHSVQNLDIIYSQTFTALVNAILCFNFSIHDISVTTVVKLINLAQL